ADPSGRPQGSAQRDRGARSPRLSRGRPGGLRRPRRRSPVARDGVLLTRRRRLGIRGQPPRNRARPARDALLGGGGPERRRLRASRQERPRRIRQRDRAHGTLLLPRGRRAAECHEPAADQRRAERGRACALHARQPALRLSYPLAARVFLAGCVWAVRVRLTAACTRLVSLATRALSLALGSFPALTAAAIRLPLAATIASISPASDLPGVAAAIWASVSPERSLALTAAAVRPR